MCGFIGNSFLSNLSNFELNHFIVHSSFLTHNIYLVLNAIMNDQEKIINHVVSKSLIISIIAQSAVLDLLLHNFKVIENSRNFEKYIKNSNGPMIHYYVFANLFFHRYKLQILIKITS